MAWGKAKTSSLDGWLKHIQSQPSLIILPFRQLSSEDAITLFQALEDNTSLLEFSASGKPLSEEAIEAAATMLIKNSVLKQLSVGDLSFGNSGLAILSKGLQRNTALQRLDLSYKGLSAGAGELLTSVLENNTSLQELVLSRNDKLNDVEIANMFMHHNNNTNNNNNDDDDKDDDNNNNNDDTKNDDNDDDANTTTSTNTTTTSLRVLDLGQTGLTHIACPSLQPVMSTITTLILSANHLGAEGGNFLGAYVGSGKCSLHVLELNSCKLGGQGAGAICEGLPESKIKKLYLNDNDIDSTCGELLSKAFSSQSLELLSFRNNPAMGDGVAEKIGSVLESISTELGSVLNNLDVGQCGLTWVGARFLLVDSPLLTLSLFGNKLSRDFDHTTTEFEDDMFTRACKVVDLDLSGNELCDEGAFKVLQRLESGADQLGSLRVLGMGANNPSDKAVWHDRIETFNYKRASVSVQWS